MRTSKIAIVAPPSESTSPKVAMPVISYGLVTPRVVTLTVCPTFRSPFLATPASSTTCVGPCAQWPFLSFSGLNCGWEVS